MLEGIITTIATYEKEIGSKPKAITIDKYQFLSLILEFEKKYNKKIDDPYGGFILNNVRVEWEE